MHMKELSESQAILWSTFQFGVAKDQRTENFSFQNIRCSHNEGIGQISMESTGGPDTVILIWQFSRTATPGRVIVMHPEVTHEYLQQGYS